MLKILNNTINFISTYIAAIGIGAGVAIAFYNVVARYVFDDSLTWAAELTTYAFIWSTFFGAVYCFRTDSHIAINILAKAPARVRKVSSLLSLFITFIYVAAIAWFGYEYLLLVNELEEMSIDLEIPMWIIYLVIPVSFGLMAIVLLQKIIETLKTPADQIQQNDAEISDYMKQVKKQEKENAKAST